MIALRVVINESSAIVGGSENLSVLSAIITGTGKLGSRSHPPREQDPHDFHISLRGLTARGEGLADEHLQWLQRELHVGDKITVEIIETDTADAIVSGQEAEKRALDERAYFEHCKKGYLELRGKFEPES